MPLQSIRNVNLFAILAVSNIGLTTEINEDSIILAGKRNIPKGFMKLCSLFLYHMLWNVFFL